MAKNSDKNKADTLTGNPVHSPVSVKKKVVISKKQAAPKTSPKTIEECEKAHVAETYRLEDEDDACNDSVQ